MDHTEVSCDDGRWMEATHISTVFVLTAGVGISGFGTFGFCHGVSHVQNAQMGAITITNYRNNYLFQ
jgi:hypothetical protein